MFLSQELKFNCRPTVTLQAFLLLYQQIHHQGFNSSAVHLVTSKVLHRHVYDNRTNTHRLTASASRGVVAPIKQPHKYATTCTARRVIASFDFPPSDS